MRPSLVRRRATNDSGAVTAELAVAFAAIVFVLTVATGAIRVVAAQLQCVDAARVAVRLAARGETNAAVVAAAVRVAPSGATVTVRTSGDAVTVEVAARPVLVQPLPAMDVRGVATAATEGRG